MHDPDNPVMVIARRAWDGFVAGRATGDWTAFLDTLSDDVTFFISSPGPFQGENHGKHRIEDFAQHAAAHGDDRIRFEEPVRVSREGTTVVFEAWDDGSDDSGEMANRVAISFDVDDGRIITVREYVGVMD